MSLCIFSAASASAANHRALSPARFGQLFWTTLQARRRASHVDEQHRTSLKISGFVVISVVNRLFSGRRFAVSTCP